MEAPNGTKLITLDQLEYLRQNTLCLIWNNYSAEDPYLGVGWLAHPSKHDIFDRLDGCDYAISVQDYYHYFGYDVMLPSYQKEKFNPWCEVGLGRASELWMSYDNDTWSIKIYDYSPRGYSDLFKGTEAECRDKLVEMLTRFLPKYLPFKVNFKFED